MVFGLRAKLFIAFGLLTITSIGNFGFLWLAEKNAAEQQAWVQHTHQVIVESEIFLGHLRDAETGQRGFLLTGRSEYLEPYNIGVNEAKAGIQKLKDLTIDNPIQQPRLAIIQKKMTLKLLELEKTIRLAQQGRRAESLAIVNSDVGKKVMDDIRIDLLEFDEVEGQLLVMRKSKFRAEQITMRMLFAGEAILLVGLIIVIAFSIQRNMVTPVIALTRNATRFAAGEDVVAVKALSKDEMGELVNAFNNMVGTVNESLENLQLSQKETQEKENRLSEIIWSTNIGTWEWNLDTDEMQLNERWAEVAGYRLSELEPVNGNTWRKILHPDDLKLSLEQLDKHYSGEMEHYECEVRMGHNNGSWVWVVEHGKVVEWTKDGKPLRMSGTITDVTERKEIERAKSEFVSTVSHELRTPLTSIKGSLGLIKSGVIGDLPGKLQSMLDIAYNNSDRLVLLINDILDMEKIEAGKMDFHMKPVEMQSLVDEAIEANRGYGDEHGVSFVRSGKSEQMLAMADKDRLMQVLANLMSNAAKFSPEGEKVVLSISRQAGDIRIEVEDKGPGIPEEFRTKIFEKFSQADSSDTRKIGGTGLGLSITRAIVEKHNGTLDFETETGKGSTFFISLPELTEAVHPKSVEYNLNNVGNRILICEDEADVATILEAMLKDAGFQTGISRTAAQAKLMLEEEHFDAMTLDLGLPDQDGISLMQDLRKNPKTQDLPVVVVSATANEGKQELNGDAIGVIDWIEKPVEPEVLVERLSKALRHLEDTLPHILHVEDDDSVLRIVATLVYEIGKVTAARTLKDARTLLESERFDLVLLDLMLPDGNGESLLPLLNKPDQPSVPVVVFSSRDISRETARSIEVALLKTRTSNEELLSVIKTSIETRTANVG
jgi:PAS domain S-box-containing protein